jgi:hypothetical protein
MMTEGLLSIKWLGNPSLFDPYNTPFNLIIRQLHI